MELDPEQDLLRFMIYSEDPELVAYYTSTAIQAIEMDFGQEDFPSAFIKERATRAVETKDLAWMKFLLLQALAWSPSFRVYVENYTRPAQLLHQRHSLDQLSQSLGDFLQGKSRCVHYDHLVCVEIDRLFRS